MSKQEVNASPLGRTLFHNEARAGADECAIDTRTAQNQSIADYMTFNFYRTNKAQCDEEVSKVKEFASQNRLVFHEGYGLANGCVIDDDSKIRLGGELTNERFKEQLHPRIYHAVPNLNRGGLETLVESRLTQGENTGVRRQCEVREAMIDRFVPLLPCLSGSIQNPAHIVPEWTWGGESSRDTVRQRQFLQDSGYQFDGVAWTKKVASCGDRVSSR